MKHDSILLQLVKDIQTILPKESMLYADLDGKQAEGNPPDTIPPNVLCTPLCPDLKEENMWLLELTVPTRGLAEARARKQHKQEYHHHISDIESRGFKRLPCDI